MARNLRRDHIDDEMRWIRKVLAHVEEGEAVGKGEAVGTGEAVGKGAAKISKAELIAVEMQWRFYRREQRRLEQRERRLEHRAPLSRGLNATAHDGATAADDEPEDARDDAPWMRQTACAEGAMIVSHLRSNLTRCVLCAWFNEWHRFGERDQLSLSYVLHAMGLSPPDEGGNQHAMGLSPPEVGADEGVTAALEHPQQPLPQQPPPQQLQHPHPLQQHQHRGVYLWPREEHWHYKRPQGAPKTARAPPYVKYTGHGGCAEEAAALITPGCGAHHGAPTAKRAATTSIATSARHQVG